jgi:glycosyltransferase involved in cell wall biosynthesis
MRKVAQLAYSGPSGAADLGVTLALAGQRAGVPQTLALWGVENCPADRLARCQAGGIPTQVFQKKYGSDMKGQQPIKEWMAAQADADAFIVHYPASLIPLRRVFKGRKRPRIVLVEHNAIMMKRPHHWVLSALAFSLCDGVVYLTESYRQQTIKKLGPFYRKRKTTVIANGLDLGHYPRRDPAAWRDDSKPFTFGMSGRMAAAKDYGMLLQAFALLCKREAATLPAGASVAEGPSLHLELAGDGPTRPHLEELTDRLGIRPHVTFAGHLPHAQLLERMASWDAFVLATLGETQPLALMEAMAIGLPSIASNAPGVRDLLVHGKTGLMPKVLDAQGLSEAMGLVLHDSSLRRELAEAGSKEIFDNYSADSMWNNYHNFIDYLNNK